jgi:hypothetical protein
MMTEQEIFAAFERGEITLEETVRLIAETIDRETLKPVSEEIKALIEGVDETLH